MSSSKGAECHTDESPRLRQDLEGLFLSKLAQVRHTGQYHERCGTAQRKNKPEISFIHCMRTFESSLYLSVLVDKQHLGQGVPGLKNL